MSLSTQPWLRRYRWQVLIVVILVVLGIASAIIYTVSSRPQTPQIQGINCGYISGTGFGPQRNQTGTVRQVGNCFWQAYQQCKTATMLVTHMGVDAGSTDTLVVSKQQNGCTIVDSSQFYNVNFGGSHSPITTSTCSMLQRQGAELLFSGCKGGDSSNPVSPTFTVSLEVDCGYVQNGMSADVEKITENCFAQATQHCNAATMHYAPDATIAHHSYVFTVAEAACTITDTSMDKQTGQTLGTYTCTAVAQQQDGLHFSGCGKDGTIVVPAVASK